MRLSRPVSASWVALNASSSTRRPFWSAGPASEATPVSRSVSSSVSSRRSGRSITETVSAPRSS